MKRRPRLLFVTVMVAASAMLAACGSSAGSLPPASSSTSGPDEGKFANLLPQELRDKGTLNIAMPNYPAAVIKTGPEEPTGFEVDLAKKLGSLLGMKVKLEVPQFDTIIPGLQSGRYDLAMGLIGINPTRQKQLAFVSTTNAPDGFLARKGSGLSINSLKDACGHSVASVTGSQEANALQSVEAECAAAGNPITVSLFQDTGQTQLALQSSRVDLVLSGTSPLVYVIRQFPDKFELAGTLPADVIPSLCGIAIPPQPSWQQEAEALQTAVNYLLDSGWQKQSLQQWQFDVGLIEKSDIYPFTGSSASGTDSASPAP
ncbi:polar amino acid transport system substrate-binding protein [Arthrobacter sp. B1I2]|nr:polar amino acid transport system substrate-binding protein [Arthrobacter sp. B1I2]